MRGYRLLKHSGQINLISKVKQALTEQELKLTDKSFSAFFMGAGYFCGEIVVRQYLLIRIGGWLGLNHALLYASGKRGGKVIYPLPKAWRKTISQHGFKVANFRSSLLWQLYIIGGFLYGVSQIFKIVFSGMTSLCSKDIKPKRHVYFAHLNAGNLPQGREGEKSYDIVSWYLQWSKSSQNFDAVHHSVPNVANKIVGAVELVYQSEMLPPLIGFVAIVKFVVWAMCSCFIALIDCFRGRWWHAFLLNQAALSAQLRSLPKSRLACEYLFHNSNWIYKPLWTYEAEKVGSKITFYFYSSNCENFKKNDTKTSISYGWKAMSWPNYLVWDSWQADFVRASVGNSCRISIVGPIWFQSSLAELSKFSSPCVAVFDVIPYRKSRYISLGIDNEFYTPDVTNPFLQQVSNTIFKQRLFMYWKRKRSVGYLTHPLYLQMTDKLAKNNHIKLVDPGISAERVIEASDAVISMPFTSTALIAREMGKPSVYYDPTGLLMKDDPAGHGIPVLSNTTELESWLSAQAN